MEKEGDPGQNSKSENSKKKMKVLDSKLNNNLNAIETSKLGRMLPLGIKEIDSRDLEFMSLLLKLIFCIFSMVISSLKLENSTKGSKIVSCVDKYVGIALFFVSLIEIIFACVMFAMTIKNMFLIFALVVFTKLVLIIICLLCIVIISPGFISAFSTLSLAVCYIGIDYMNIFYLRNSIKILEQLPPKKDPALEKMINETV